MGRPALIARIHIAKAKALVCSNCGRLFFGTTCPGCAASVPKQLDQWRYQEILKAIGGEGSCTDLEDTDLEKVMEFFDQAGFSKAHPYISPKREMEIERHKVIRYIQIRAPVVLGSDWERRVLGFIQAKIHKQKLEWCDADELRKVIGWINRTYKYQQGRR